ncbi:SDR family oxidoreductase [soil metagenome]
MFTNQTVVVVGGTSGIGLRVAQQVIAQGGSAWIGGRSRGKLDQALALLGPRASGGTVDVAEPASIAAFFAPIGTIDHLFTPGASYVTGPIGTLDEEAAQSPFRSKFWGQYWSVRYALPKLSAQASVVLMAGAAGARPMRGAAAYAACNSALEGLGRALALELAPRRVNTVSPGTVDSPLWRDRPQAQREAAYQASSAANALQRVGHVDEIADAVLFLMRNAYTTGSTLYPDGGYTLR